MARTDLKHYRLCLRPPNTVLGSQMSDRDTTQSQKGKKDMSSKSTRLATIFIVVIMGLISPCVCASLGSALETGSLSNLLSSIDALTWGILLVASVGLLPDILASISVLKHPDISQQDYPAPIRFLAQFTRYISVAVPICYLVLNQHSGLSSIVGQPTAMGFLSSSFASVIVFSCFVVMYGLGYRLVHKRKQEVDPANPAVRMFSIQRTILERAVFLPILVLGAITPKKAPSQVPSE